MKVFDVGCDEFLEIILNDSTHVNSILKEERGESIFVVASLRCLEDFDEYGVNSSASDEIEVKCGVRDVVIVDRGGHSVSEIVIDSVLFSKGSEYLDILDVYNFFFEVDLSVLGKDRFSLFSLVIFRRTLMDCVDVSSARTFQGKKRL